MNYRYSLFVFGLNYTGCGKHFWKSNFD